MSNDKPNDMRFQANFKSTNGTLLNLYAEDAAMLSQMLQELEELATQINAVETVFFAAQKLGATKQPSKNYGSSNLPSASGQPQQAMNQATCEHGERRPFSGSYKNGGEWTAYGCPLDRNDPARCPTIDSKGKVWAS